MGYADSMGARLRRGAIRCGLPGVSACLDSSSINRKDDSVGHMGSSDRVEKRNGVCEGGLSIKT